MPRIPFSPNWRCPECGTIKSVCIHRDCGGIWMTDTERGVLVCSGCGEEMTRVTSIICDNCGASQNYGGGGGFWESLLR